MTLLPIPLTSLIGRKKERAELLQLVGTSRLITITGVGGCGKTRLALCLANEVKNQFPDGIFWVGLASIRDAHLIPQILAKALGISSNSGDLTNTLVGNLADKALLIVFDNCEHLNSPCAMLIDKVLQAPGVKVLVTTREPLFLSGEVLYPVAPLAVPSVTVKADIQDYDAVRLFIERAKAILPGFRLTPENQDIVANICRQLDGLPLAIELASARINVLTVEQINARLSDRFLLLGNSPHPTTSHHRSLQTAFDWSYDLLLPLEQIVLQRLSVFMGGCSLTTAETICVGDGVKSDQVFYLLASLISKSILVSQTLQQGEARYSLLETIRQYAHEKLVSSGKLAVIRDRHLQCFVNLTEEVLPKLSGTYQQVWLNWLDGEFDNIRAALSWALESSQIEAGLRIAIAIYQFWTIRDYAEEGLVWMERLLSKDSEKISPIIHANAFAYTVFLAGFRGNSATQAAYGQKAEVLAQSLDAQDKTALKWALTAQAYGAQAVGDYEIQFNIMKQVIQITRELGDKYQLGLTLSVNSFTAMLLGQLEEAQSMLQEALPLLREVGNPYRIAMALNFFGDLARCKKNYAEAQLYYNECISLLRQLSAPRDLASALQNLGFTCLHLGKIGYAKDLFKESLELQAAQKNYPGLSECLIGFAATSAEAGKLDVGARLLAAAVNIGGSRVISTWPATQMEYEHFSARIRNGLAEREFQAQQKIGQSLNLQQVMEYVRKSPFNTAIPVESSQQADVLSSREREIVLLIAQGYSNGEIATSLVLSKRTVEKHIAHILLKLGTINRAQIVRWAFDNGQLTSINNSKSQ